MSISRTAREKRDRSGRPSGSILQKAIRQVLPDLRLMRRCSVEVLEPRRLLSTAVWTGNAHDNNWATATNWSGGSGTGGVPAAGDSVSIGTGFTTINIPSGTVSLASITSGSPLNLANGTMTVGAGGATLSDGFTIAAGEADFNGTSTITNYGQTAGILGGSGSVSLTGTSVWTGGTMNGTGTTVIPASSALSLLGNANGQDTMSRSFTNNGAITWTENAGDTNEYLFVGGNFQNNGTFTATTSSASGNLNINHNGGTNSFTNASGATITANGAGNLAFNSEALNNAGSVVVNSGQLLIGGGGTETGTFSGAGAVTISTNTTTLTGVTIPTLNLISGEADFNGTSSVGSLNQSAGILGGTGSLTITGVSSWTGGTTNGTGTTNIAGTGTLNLLGNSNGQAVMSRTMINNGNVAWTENSGDANEYLDVGGSFQNFGTFTATSHASGTLNINFNGGTPSFVNETGATFNANGAGTESVGSSLPFNNDATVNVNGAEFILNGGGTHVSGAFVLAPTSTLALAGTGSFDVNTAITGGGTVQVVGGVSTFNSMSLGGTLSIIGGEADFNGTSSVTGLNETGGTLGGSGSFTLNGVSSWTGGTMNGSGSTFVAPSATLNVLGGASTISLSRTLVNNGAVQWTEGSSDSNEYLYLAAAIQNFGTFTANTHAAGNDNFQNNGGTPSFTNESTGTFNANGAGTVNFNSIPFNNAGSVNVTAGTLNLNGGGTHTTPFAVSTGTTLQLEGTQSFAASSGVTGAGTVAVINGISTFNSATISGTLKLIGGEADFNGTTSIGTLDETGGTLGGNGTVTLSGNSIWSGGTMNGAGTTTLATNVTLTLLGVTNSSVILSRTFINNGTIFWTEASADSNEYLYLAASLQNFGTFSATAHANGNLNFQNNGGTPSFTNESGATFAMNGAGNLVVNSGIPFNNAGIATVTGGELDLHGGGTQTTPLSLASGTTLDLQGTETFTSTSGISGSGTVSISSGTTTFNGVTISGLLNITNGTANFNTAASSAGSLNMSGGNLGGAAAVTLNGNSSWTAGTMNGTGSTIIAPGVTLTLLGNTNGSAVLSRTLVNNGIVSWTEAAADVNEYFYMSTAFQNFGMATFTAHAGGNLNIQNNSGTPSFTNESTGTFTAAGAGNVNFNNVAFNNAGSANVNAGQLGLGGGGTQTAGFTGLPGATLEFSGAHTFTAAATITGNVNVQVDNGTADFLANLATTGNIQFNGGTWSIEGTVSATQLNLTGGTLNLNGSSTFTLNETGGTLGGSATVTLAGASTWTGGTMNGTGATVVPSNATLGLLGNSNGSDIMSRTFINNGAVTWTENSGDVNEYLYLAGSFENFGSFTATTHTSGNLNLLNNSGSPSFVNESGAIFVLNGPGHIQVNAGIPFNNAASVSVNGGQLNLDGGGTQTGTYALASGTALGLSGTHNFTVSSGITGTGNVTVSGGVTTFNGQNLSGTLNLLGGEVDFNATSSVGALIQTGGTLGGTGSVTFLGASSWTAGTMNGTGSTVIAPSATMTLMGTSNGSVIMSRTLINQGNMSWTEAATDNNEYLYLAGPLQNYGTFTFTTHASGNFNLNNNGGSPSFINESGATFTASGGGAVLINNGVPFTNGGTISLVGGLLNLASVVSNLTASNTILTGGNWNIQAAGELRFSNTSNIAITTDAANITLDGTGSKITQNNGTTSAIGTLNHVAAGGSLTVVDGLNLAITPAATITNDGTIGLGVGSTLAITGAFAQNTGGTLNVQLASVSSFGQLTVSGAATLGGTLGATLATGYSLTPADIIPVLVAHSPNGTFSAFAAPPSPAPPLNLNYTSGAVDIVVGSATITISPPVLPHATAGVSFTPSLSASGGIGTNYTFTVTAGALPNGIQLSTGGVFSGDSTLAGSYPFTVTASDGSGDQGVQAYVLTVDPAAINSLVFGGLPPTQTAGTTQHFTVTAEDAFGNTVTGDNDALIFTISDPRVSAPTGSLVSGTGSFSELMYTAGNQTLTVKDNAITASANITVNPAAIAAIQLTGLPNTVTAGVAHLLTVSAVDPYGNTETSNSDTVNITSSDGAAQIPATVQLNNGIATFNATLESTGSQSITVRDGVFGASQQTSVNPAGVSQLVVSPLTGPAIAGSAESFTVTAEDSFGNVVTGDNDALVFSSPTDGSAVLPSGSLSSGHGTFSVTFKRAGNETIRVADGGIIGSQSVQISPAPFSTLSITGLPGSQIAGTPEPFTVTAFDPYGNVATGDNDPLTFDSSDPQAVLPTGALISGTGNFSLTLKTTGSKSLTVHDGSVSQQQSVQVFAAGVNNLLLSPLPSSVQAGTAQSFTVTARDAFGNTVTSDNDPLSFNSSDGAATLPTGSLASGTGTFFVTFRTAGARSITVNDNGVTQIDNTVVSPGPTDHLLINFTSGSPTAGVSDGVTISAFDQFGNLATGDNDPLGFSSSDLRAVLPSGHLTNGTGSFNVTFISAGVQSLTVTDQTISKSGSVNVIPGPTQSLTITGLPPTMTAGTSHTFTVQALDAFGNFATGDNDTLSFSSNDSNATLPIGSLVNGAGIFSVTFRTAGSRFVNATDNGIVGGGDTTTVVAGAPFSMSLSPLPTQVTAGVSQGINVTLFDQFGNVASSDNDLLSLTSSDPQAVLSPATLNGGIGTVGVTFKTAGPQSVTVHDLTISGSDSTTVLAANATVLSITNLNANPTAGAADGFTVIARDPFGNIATGDNDTLNFGSTDSQAVLPTGSLTNGIGTFSVTFKTAGSQSISAHDGILLAIGPVTVAPGPLASLAIVGLPASSSAGTMLPFTVTAHDAFGNVVTGDNHTLTFSSSDGLAVLPTGGLTNGTGSFDVTFNSAGPQTMTVFDGSIAQTAHVTIAASTIDHLGINVSNSSPNAGQAITFTVTAFDSHGNVASTDNDTLVFNSSDSKAVLPTGALTNGIGNFGATFKTAGTDSLTVTDGSVSISTNFNVIPGPTASLVVSGLPATVVAGTSHLFTVTAFDAFGNIATSDNNTPNFQSSDPQATLPIGPLSNGVGTFAITLRTAGNQFVNAIENGIVGTGDSTTVQAAAPQFMHLTPLPSQVTAGVQATLTATLIDPFGNVVTLDNDPLSFTLSDPLATLPTATLIDGQATVGITFKTAGLQSITVHDQAISSIDSTTVVAASPATLSILNLNPNPIAGAPDSFNLIARDAFGNIATGDNDTLSFTSSDPLALLPIGSLSSGIGTFSITFKTAGGQSVTAHDGSLFATGSVTVSPGALASLTISGLPPSSSAGISLPFTVTAHDAFGNTVTNDNDVLSFNSTDPLAVLPSAGSSLNHGAGAFAVTFNSPNVQSITVIDGSVSQTAFVNINANAPSTPSMPVLDPSTDSGVKGDNVTNVTTPLLTGTAQAGSTVSFFDSGAPIGSTIATPSGTYSFVPAVQLGNGQHVITAQASNSAGTSGMSAPLPLTIDTMLPAVQSVVINDGSAQRSMVDSITIHFTEAINFSPTAFELDTVDPTTGVSTPVTATITPTLSSDGMSVTLTFSGSGIINRSLADGNYVLTVHASGIQDLAGNAMGDGSVTKFHRLFGDIDGDGHITSVDLLAWRTALNQTTSSSHYVWYLDFDGINGDDRNDYNQVLARYLNRTTYTN